MGSDFDLFDVLGHVHTSNLHMQLHHVRQMLGIVRQQRQFLVGGGALQKLHDLLPWHVITEDVATNYSHEGTLKHGLLQ